MRVNNRATRLNRAMMYGTLFLGLLVIGVAIGALYISYDIQQSNKDMAASGDSLLIEVEDSSLIEIGLE